MKYFFVAGEKSGDLHAGNLAAAMKDIQPNVQIWGWGGENMQQAGVKVLKHYNDLAFMGFWEVLVHLPKILGFLNTCKQQINEIKPDGVVLVDYGGFNLRLVRWAREQGYKVFYYIPPKAWAWNQSRAKKLRNVDLTLSILPFEVPFFEKFGVKIKYVGNPLFDEIRKFKVSPNFLNEINNDGRPIIALLPGSRKQEVLNMLAIMARISENLPEFHFVVGGISDFTEEFYRSSGGRFTLAVNRTYDLLNVASAAIVTSGTATLETALFKVPQVVVYKTSKLSYLIAKQLIKVKYISLVNLIADKPVVKEVIQGDYTMDGIERELKRLLFDNNYREQQLKDYKKNIELLGDKEASITAAQQIVNYKLDLN